MRIVIAGALLTLGLAACGGDGFVSDGLPTTTLIEVADSVEISGAALPELKSGPDPAVGTVAPEVTGPGFTGKPVTISHDGTAKVIVFLAHWCDQCRGEVEELAPYFSALEVPVGVELYSVATATQSTRPNYPPSEWLLEAGWQLPVLVDTAGFDVARAYGLSGFPYWVVLDGEGVVLTRISGRLGVEPVEALLAKLATF